MHDLITAINQSLHTRITGISPVAGGDISQAFALRAPDAQYFLKVNEAALFPGMFALEKDGLDALRAASRLAIPQVLGLGEHHGRQWLLLEWKEKGYAAPASLREFGAALADMHKQSQPFFGWHADNYIGSLVQLNQQHQRWSEFFMLCRIQPLMKRLVDNGAFEKRDARLADAVAGKIDEIFPTEPPALLHGDLWGGNYFIGSKREVVVFDPAVYYGHREMDLGMSRLFGGFSPDFYSAYQEGYPLQPGWEQRIELAQWYPLLVHAVLFGGHYVHSARQIMLRFAN